MACPTRPVPFSATRSATGLSVESAPMRPLALGLILGVLGFVPHARAADSDSGATLVVPSDLKWAENPSRPGAWQAVGEGDPKVGASHFFVKYANNCDGVPRRPSSDHGGYVLSRRLL